MDKLEFPDLKRQMILQNNLHSPDTILVEDKASGQDLIPTLKKDTTLPILAIQVDRDKTSRANSCTPTIEAGNAYLPEDNKFASQLVEQCSGFPSLKNDDIVDSLTQFLNWIRQFSNKEPVFHSLPRREINNLLQGY